jgi:large subunit ribosomal protein L24
MTTTKLKKGDTVGVLVGKDKGKSGKIVDVDRKSGRAVVEGINIHHRFQKAKANTPGQKVSFAAGMAANKLVLLCPNCNKATRIGYKILENGKKQRVCKKCEKGM